MAIPITPDAAAAVVIAFFMVGVAIAVMAAFAALLNRRLD